MTSQDDWYQWVKVYTKEEQVNLINLTYEGQQLINLLIAIDQRRYWYYSSYVYAPAITPEHLHLIEILRPHRFSYVILDESQAIKNPLAQSSKAARLLQADHRLCLTGTPVENNVYELWSQFAFLNPGLLGHFETFKSEFASAIERHDEAAPSTMQLLSGFLAK